MLLTKNWLQTLSPEDMTKYLADGFTRIKYPKDKEFFWTYIVKIAVPKRNPQFELQRDHQGNKTQIYSLGELKLNLSFPESGLYNYQKQVMSIRRIPYRGTTKIPCAATLLVSPLFGLDCFGFSLVNQKFLFSTITLNQIFEEPNNTRNPEIPDIVNLLMNQQNYCRIYSRNFAISIPLIGEHPNLWYKNRIIGYIKPEQQIYITDSIFFQEALDTFRLTNAKIIQSW